MNSYKGIRSVLDGINTSFSFEYPCNTPEGRRWFLMNATPFSRKSGDAIILHMDITSRKQQEARIYHLAHHGELTGAANRRHFYEAAQEVPGFFAALPRPGRLQGR